jgi:hypothetical protein
MKRRDLLLGSVAAALTAAWSRVSGAVAIVRHAAPLTPSRYFGAGDHLDRMFRDRKRRLIDDEAFNTAFDAAIKVLRASNDGEISDIDASARMLAVHSRALRHRPPVREIPPLPSDQVGVAEVMALLRRAISGESRIEIERPWREVFHSLGKFEIDGWKLLAFKRNRGIKYMDRAVAPDGRMGTYDSWTAREGNPVHLLTDDEQDMLDDLIEGNLPFARRKADAGRSRLQTAPERGRLR